MQMFKAKFFGVEGYYEVAVFVSGGWRTLGCPILHGDAIGYKSIRKAKAGAEKVAKAFGIKLEWVK